MTVCPNCNSRGLRRSRARSALERLRARLGERRPYRCRVCDWRGWAVPAATTGHLDAQKPAPDLSALERAETRGAAPGGARLDAVEAVLPLSRRRALPLDPRRLDEPWVGTTAQASQAETSTDFGWDERTD